MSDGIVAGLIQPMRLSSRPGPFLDVNGSAEVKQRDAVRQIPPNETGARRNQRATGRIIATTRLSNKRRGRESNPRIEPRLGISRFALVNRLSTNVIDFRVFSDYFLSMATLLKDSRDRSPFWICSYRAADG